MALLVSELAHTQPPGSSSLILLHSQREEKTEWFIFCFYFCLIYSALTEDNLASFFPLDSEHCTDISGFERDVKNCQTLFLSSPKTRKVGAFCECLKPNQQNLIQTLQVAFIVRSTGQRVRDTLGLGLLIYKIRDWIDGQNSFQF